MRWRWRPTPDWAPLSGGNLGAGSRRRDRADDRGIDVPTTLSSLFLLCLGPRGATKQTGLDLRLTEVLMVGVDGMEPAEVSEVWPGPEGRARR